MRKKYVVRTHPVLFFGGRLLLVLFLAFMAATIILSFVFRHLIFVIDAIIFVPLGIFVLYNFWHNCFGKLVITEKYVRYRCLFTLSVTLSAEDIKYIDIREFREGNVAAPKNGVCQKYLLLSSEPLPSKRIDKIKRNRKLIKFPLGLNSVKV